MIGNNITKSSYNFEVEKTTYKRHFYFYIDDESIELKNILGSKHGVHFDILFDKVYEHKQNYDIKEFKPLMIGIEEINELLEHIDSKFNTSFSAKRCGSTLYVRRTNKPKTKTETIKTDTEKLKDINELKEYIECLSSARYEYANWRDVGFALHSATNEYDSDDLIDLFNTWSSSDTKPNRYKGLKSILGFWKTVKSTDIEKPGITLNSFYGWCKEDNPQLYYKLLNKYSTKNKTNDQQTNDIKLWKILEDMNHSDMAKLYHKLSPEKYAYSNTLGWFEYNNYNILIPYNKSVPSSLLSDVTNKLQELIINERNKLKPPVKTNEMSKDEHDKLMASYDYCMKLAKKGYIAIGNSSYIKNIIDYLSNLYSVNRLETLIDSNDKLLAFDNKLFDFVLNDFRDIKPTDYITKTTKYLVPKKSTDDFKFIYKLLYSIFENKEIVEYWLATTGLSLFGNKLESLYIHTGSGGNGKGLLSSILVKALGDYMYCADNTFLTSVFRSGQANPTLAKCQGIRYLLVSEPDDGSEDVKFNVDFIKMLTGGDIITTRDLFKSNISYKPQFTPFVQCNNKPKLGKIDNGIKRRLKIINYPLMFVDKPAKSNDRPIDYSLKDKIFNDGVYEQFILLLIEKAVEYKDKKLVQPEEVENQTKEYFDENDPVKGWLANSCEITDNDKDQIKTSDLYNRFVFDSNSRISSVKFMDYMKLNNIEHVSKKGYKYFICIKFLQKEEDNDNEL